MTIRNEEEEDDDQEEEEEEEEETNWIESMRCDAMSRNRN
jgi:hypothetical protein